MEFVLDAVYNFKFPEKNVERLVKTYVFSENNQRFNHSYSTHHSCNYVGNGLEGVQTFDVFPVEFEENGYGGYNIMYELPDLQGVYAIGNYILDFNELSVDVQQIKV